MQKYIYLMKWTDQGARDSMNSVHRATAAMDTMQTFGARIYEAYWTTGPYDLVYMAEVPDAATAHTVKVALARNGNIRAHAMLAFDRSTMLDIVKRLEEDDDA